MKVSNGTDFGITEELSSLLAKNNGVITASQANEVDISNQQLAMLVQRGDLERAAHGIYTVTSEIPDKLYINQLLRPKVIYSHDTALFLHGLSDRDPHSPSLTVPTGYKARNLREDGYTVFTIKRDLHSLGTTRMYTLFGNPVTVYNPERTICDVLRSRSQMDIALVTEAIKRYAAHQSKDINSLMQMSDIFGVSRLLRPYLEVLL